MKALIGRYQFQLLSIRAYKLVLRFDMGADKDIRGFHAMITCVQHDIHSENMGELTMV